VSSSDGDARNNEGSGLGVDAGRDGQPSRREVVIAAAMAPMMVGVGQLGRIASEIWSQAASSSPSRSLTNSLARPCSWSNFRGEQDSGRVIIQRTKSDAKPPIF
jgi:hypothetical protein